MSAQAGIKGDGAGVAEHQGAVTIRASAVERVVARTAQDDLVARARDDAVVAARRRAGHVDKQRLVLAIGITTASEIEVVARQHIRGGASGKHLDAVVAHAASHHVEVAAEVGGLAGDGQCHGVVATRGHTRVQGGHADHAAVCIEADVAVVARHEAFMTGQRDDLDAVVARATDHHLVAVARGHARAQRDLVACAIGQAQAGDGLQPTQEVARGACRELHAAGIAQHHATALARRDLVAAGATHQQVLAVGGLQHVTRALVQRQAAERDDVTQAAVARDFGVVAHHHHRGPVTRHPQAVGAHATHQDGGAQVAAGVPIQADLDGVVVARHGALIQGLQEGQVAGQARTTKLQQGVVAHGHAELGPRGVDDQAVAALAPHEGQATVTHHQAVVAAKAQAGAFSPGELPGAAQIEAQQARVAQDQAVLDLTRFMDRVESQCVGPRAADDGLDATAGGDRVITALVGIQAADAQHPVAQGATFVLGVVAHQHVFAARRVTHQDGVGVHATDDHLVAQVGGGVAGAQRDVVGPAGGGDGVAGLDLVQTAQGVKVDVGVVAHHIAAAAPTRFVAAHTHHRGDAGDGERAAGQGQTRGLDVDHVGPEAAHDHLEAVAQGDGVVAAQHQVVGLHASQDAVLRGGVVIELTGITHDQVVAVTRRDGVVAQSAQDHLAAVTARQGVVAPLVVDGGAHLQHAVGATQAAGRCAHDLAVVTHQHVFTAGRARRQLARDRVAAGAGQVDLVAAHATDDQVGAQLAAGALGANADQIVPTGAVDGVGAAHAHQAAEGVEHQGGVIARHMTPVGGGGGTGPDGDRVAAPAAQHDGVPAGQGDGVIAATADVDL